jgi:hypothetical protein
MTTNLQKSAKSTLQREVQRACHNVVQRAFNVVQREFNVAGGYHGNDVWPYVLTILAIG